jgi:PAS domain S-box-containing protein
MTHERFNKILVIDDSPANLHLLLGLLKEKGYTVYPALDGELALKFLQSTLPDLILLDIKIPKMDGYEVCRRLKANQRTSSIPVIFLSAKGDELDKVKGFQAGGVDYITKPFQPEEMLARVRIHLRMRELTEDLEQEVEERTKELIVSNKRLEEEVAERRQVEEALRISSERLQLATRTAKIGIWDWDLVKNKLLWDESMCQLYGIQERDFGEVYDEWASALHPEDKAHAEGEIQAALRGEREYTPEFRILRPDGSTRYIKAESKTFRDRDGKPLRMIGTNIDITDQKQAEMEIHRLNQELEQRVVERTAQLEAAIYDLENFNYSASHDLRIPLRAIDGFSRILLDEYSQKLDAEGIRLLSVVRDNTKKLAQYIDDMQAFSRTGRMAMAPVEIDMQALVRDVMEELEPAGDGRHIKLEINNLPTVYGDKPMLRWVLVNLLSNAIKFSRNQVTPRISVGATIEANEAIFFVQDNGVGFDMQYADKLFGVFERLHNVNEFEGTGIGLAIVKRIVSRHGGRVWAEGKVNEGATIYFSIPTGEKQRED